MTTLIDTKQLRTGADGRALALAMFRELGELEDDDLERCYLSGREGRVFNNVVLKYLDRLEGANCREALSGFAELLTDYLVYTNAGTEIPMYEQIEYETH